MATDIRQPAIEIPPLQPGDRLTRVEFERRWETMPGLKKAELIDGAVHMPAVSRMHGTPHFDINGLLWYYKLHTPGVEGSDNASLRLDDDNMPQPDALLRILVTHGGRSRVDADHFYIDGPELIVEVARSSVALDLGAKKNLYQRYGVPEYIVWRVSAAAVDWFVLKAGQYVLRDPGADKIIRSEVLPGLWIHTQALVSDDSATLIAAAQQGLGSPEHTAFVAELRRRSST